MSNTKQQPLYHPSGTVTLPYPGLCIGETNHPWDTPSPWYKAHFNTLYGRNKALAQAWKLYKDYKPPVPWVSAPTGYCEIMTNLVSPVIGGPVVALKASLTFQPPYVAYDDTELVFEAHLHNSTHQDIKMVRVGLPNKENLVEWLWGQEITEVTYQGVTVVGIVTFVYPDTSLFQVGEPFNPPADMPLITHQYMDLMTQVQSWREYI